MLCCICIYVYMYIDRERLHLLLVCCNIYTCIIHLLHIYIFTCSSIYSSAAACYGCYVNMSSMFVGLVLVTEVKAFNPQPINNCFYSFKLMNELEIFKHDPLTVSTTWCWTHLNSSCVTASTAAAWRKHNRKIQWAQVLSQQYSIIWNLKSTDRFHMSRADILHNKQV